MKEEGGRMKKRVGRRGKRTLGYAENITERRKQFPPFGSLCQTTKTFSTKRLSTLFCAQRFGVRCVPAPLGSRDVLPKARPTFPQNAREKSGTRTCRTPKRCARQLRRRSRPRTFRKRCRRYALPPQSKKLRVRARRRPVLAGGEVLRPRLIHSSSSVRVHPSLHSHCLRLKKMIRPAATAAISTRQLT